MGDRLAARVDLKSDRPNSRLRVLGAYLEPWADADAVLAGDGPVARSPRAVAISLAALVDAGLVEVGSDALVAVKGAGQADLEAGAIGLRAAALADEARVLTGRAMTMDLLGATPEWLPDMTGALS